MAHFAKIEDGVVTQVIVVDNKDCADASGVEKEYIGAAFCERLLGGTWKQTSYNGSIRKNYAGVGYAFDAERDAFIPPKPYNSWLLNEDTCLWEAPVAMPADAGTGEPPKRYTWDEATTSWVESEYHLEGGFGGMDGYAKFCNMRRKIRADRIKFKQEQQELEKQFWDNLILWIGGGTIIVQLACNGHLLFCHGNH
jgi:hypothetical protein